MINNAEQDKYYQSLEFQRVRREESLSIATVKFEDGSCLFGIYYSDDDSITSLLFETKNDARMQ